MPGMRRARLPELKHQVPEGVSLTAELGEGHDKRNVTDAAVCEGAPRSSFRSAAARGRVHGGPKL
jgi:hypothetical protein